MGRIFISSTNNIVLSSKMTVQSNSVIKDLFAYNRGDLCLNYHLELNYLFVIAECSYNQVHFNQALLSLIGQGRQNCSIQQMKLKQKYGVWVNN